MRSFDNWYIDEFYNGRKYDLYQQPLLPTSKTATIPLNPHYSDPRFAGKGEVEIWGSKQPGLHYDYSDRFYQWDYKRAKAAAIVASESVGNHRTAAWVEAFISAFHDKPVEVCHIYSGVNYSSGHPYWAAGYKYKN